ncbi:iron-containing alcohol dehydrogenase [soil metagenome]
MTSTLTGTLRLPTRIHFGYGARAQLPELVGLHGTRVLAVVDPFLTQTDIFRETLGALQAAGSEVLVYSEILPELPVASLDAAGVVAREFGPDVILAIGGGSALDAAKLVGLLAAHGGPLSQYDGENAVPGPLVPTAAVPTTSGTGSGVTPVAVISDPERALKVGISSPYLIPVAAVVDPEFTLGAPASVTAFSGIDALVHAGESYTSSKLPTIWTGTLPVFTGQNAFADVLALQAAEKLGRWLAVAVAEPANREAREQVALGSLLAGMSFGPTGTHLSHALQYPIGASTKTPHGLGTGLMLPYVLDGVRSDPDVAERIARVGVALGSTATTTDGRVSDAIAAIVRLNAAIGVPASLAEIGITAEELPRIAELGLASTRLVAIAPIPATSELLLGILTHAHSGHLTTGSAS